MPSASSLPPFTGAVLTGGTSRRMGSDKALVDLGGRPMATYALDMLRAAGATQVLAVGGDEAALGALGFTVVVERAPARGPLGAILAALEEAGDDLVVVVACDLPLVSVEAINELRRGAAGGPGSVAMVDGRLQPVLAAYRRSLSASLAQAQGGDGSVSAAIAGLGLVEVGLDAAEVGPNVNTPDDLRTVAAQLLRPRSTWLAGGAR